MEQTKEVSKEKNIDEELAALMAENEKLQAKENAGDPVRADYILLAKHGSKALMKSQKDLYIEGLKEGQFYIQSSKKILGDRLRVAPLAFITIYNEYDGEDFKGTWNKEQAMTYPTADGSYYDRQLPNGHILRPTNWVMVEIIGHSEGDEERIENAVIAYKKTGSKIWKEWKNDAKARSGSSATLAYDIFAETYSNDKNEWLDINFKFAGSLIEKNKERALFCLKKSNFIRESYEKHVLIADHDTARLTAASPVAQIEDASAVEDSDTEDDLGF